MIPGQFEDLVTAILRQAEGEPRVVGVVAGGSVASGTTDQYSDLELVLVSPTDDDQRAMPAEAREFAGKAGPLLAAFTGERR